MEQGILDSSFTTKEILMEVWKKIDEVNRKVETLATKVEGLKADLVWVKKMIWVVAIPIGLLILEYFMRR